MIAIGDAIGEKLAKKIRSSVFQRGDVYLLHLNEEDGITVKTGNVYQPKFFVVLGHDEAGNVYGGVIYDSEINPNHVPPYLKDLFLPVEDYKKYSWLTHKCYIDCSELILTKRQKLVKGKKLGRVSDEDLALIIKTVKMSPNENQIRLKTFVGE